VKEFPASGIIWHLRRIENCLCEIESRYQGEPWDIQKAAVACSLVEMCTERFDIPISKMRAEELKSSILDGTMSSFEDLATELREFLRNVEYELRSHLFLYVSQEQATYYTQPTKGWEKIIERWESTVRDIEEARKCFALNRYAASVFHSLQVIELGLLELGKFIHVVDPQSGWTAITRELEKILKKKYPERSDFEKKHSSFLEQVQATVEALKNAWRNKISHTQGRLTLLSADFTAEITEDILVASRAFMRRLAVEMPSTVSESEQK